LLSLCTHTLIIATPRIDKSDAHANSFVLGPAVINTHASTLTFTRSHINMHIQHPHPLIYTYTFIQATPRVDKGDAKSDLLVARSIAGSVK